MTGEELKNLLECHKSWLTHIQGGERANLRGANLRGADLQGADLQGADLRGADLWGADLWRANLRGANLRDADLQDANLWGANLRGADLQGADLDFACLPLWCGGQFKADNKICKQLVAHVVRIMELSGIDEPDLITAMNEYKKGWHREQEF